MKQFKVPLILMFATFFAAALLMFSEFSTKDEIEKQKNRLLVKSLEKLIPANLHDNDLTASKIIIPADAALGVTKPQVAYLGTLDHKPSVIALPAITKKGYSGDIEIMVGIKMNGEITSVKIIDQRETPGLGDLILASKSNWIQQIKGKSLSNPSQKLWKVKKDGGHFDQLTGATISPRAVIAAVKSALVFHETNKQNYIDWIQAHE